MVDKVKHPVDVHVGQMIRWLRKQKRMTLQQLAEAVGVKSQQIQKYETASNRISMSRLCDISKVLDVAPASFFGGFRQSQQPEQPGDILVDKDGVDFLRYYYAIPVEQRGRFNELVIAMVPD